jgi:hypothetical protein
MNINDLITKKDLLEFKNEIINYISSITNQNDSNKQWLRTKEALNYLKISSGTLQNLKVSGKLPYKKVGGTVYYSLNDLETLFK